MQMQTEYQRHIAELDKTLSMLREGWMESKPADKSKWMDRINSMLDERLRLMSLRDNAPACGLTKKAEPPRTYDIQ